MCVFVRLEILPARGFSIVTAVFGNRCIIGSPTSSLVGSLRKKKKKGLKAFFLLSQLISHSPSFFTAIPSLDTASLAALIPLVHLTPTTFILLQVSACSSSRPSTSPFTILDKVSSPHPSPDSKQTCWLMSVFERQISRTSLISCELKSSTLMTMSH